MTVLRAPSIIACLLLLSVPWSPARAQDSRTAPDAVTGVWLTADQDARIEIFRQDNSYCGKIVWMKEPEEFGKPKRDTLNPDVSLRDRPLMNLVIMRGFIFDGEEEWTGGKVYDPKSGKEYTGTMWLEDSNTLMLRGYVLVRLFGRSEKWIRVSAEGGK